MLQVFDDMLDDDQVKSIPGEGDFFSAGNLEGGVFRDWFGLSQCPWTDIRCISLEFQVQLSDEMTKTGTDFESAPPRPGIPARQDGIELVRPPVLAVPGERNFLIGVGFEILIVESHVFCGRICLSDGRLSRGTLSLAGDIKCECTILHRLCGGVLSKDFFREPQVPPG